MRADVANTSPASILSPSLNTESLLQDYNQGRQARTSTSTNETGCPCLDGKKESRQQTKAVDCTRVWLPAQVCNSSLAEVSLALVGWVNAGPKSLDLVVAAACPVTQLSNPVIRQLQEVLDAAETKLPLTLRIQRKLRVIGQYFICPDGNVGVPGVGRGGNSDERENGYLPASEETNSYMKLSAEAWHGRSFHVGEKHQKFDSKTDAWAVVSARKRSTKRNGWEWTPYLRSLCLGGCHSFGKYHIVVYEQPVFGSHHFSCLPWTPAYEVSSQKSFGQKQQTSLKRPQWFTDAAPQEEAGDIDIAMMELNCATYVDEILKGLWSPASFCEEHQTMSSMTMLTVCLMSRLMNAVLLGHAAAGNYKASCRDYFWSLIAAVMALWAAILYAVAQGLALILAVWLPAVPYLGSLLQRSMTWQATHIRCQQLRAWPFILLWGGLGPEQPNVAIAHQLKHLRYSTLSVLLIDEIFGAIAGYFLLKYRDIITKLVVQTARILTNDILRTGCIWLMGVPAGFKLNIELAASIGTMSLHVIQSWSTLLFTLNPAIKIFLVVLGISSFLLGFTIPAAVVSDLIFLSTFHISCLHHAVAFLHTNQLRALASLWRLFRGWKRNPLRRRLDTFECSVEQLVVCSLMFTPLLLLLPTTSVYYTFFSMIFLTLSSVQFMLYYLVAIVHCFPLSLVATWIVRPNQFPSGIWFQFSEPMLSGDKHEEALLSTLGIRPAIFGELLKPFLRTLWVMPEWSSAASFLYKVVSGERYHLKLQLGHMASLPHSPLSLMGFARLSYVALRKASQIAS